jgi:hypothetical protein
MPSPPRGRQRNEHQGRDFVVAHLALSCCILRRTLLLSESIVSPKDLARSSLLYETTHPSECQRFHKEDQVEAAFIR